MQQQKPFLKWAGNKYRILDRILRLLPEGQRLIEPFAGSAALSLNTSFPRYLLADSNADLINLYQTLKQQREDFIDYSRQFFNPQTNAPDVFYSYREEFNSSTDKLHKAALFLYLNRHGYNGLCRYNLKGIFNVPFGRYKRPYFPENEMRTFVKKSCNTLFKTQDFKKIINQAREGDVIYCDPPYAPLSHSANFTQYSTGGFNLQQQQQLAEIAKHTANRGIPVLISNHNTPFTVKTYKQAQHITKFRVQRFISCHGHKRNTAGELLALFI